jgi:biopolymer transport protein ExbB
MRRLLLLLLTCLSLTTRGADEPLAAALAQADRDLAAARAELQAADAAIAAARAELLAQLNTAREAVRTQRSELAALTKAQATAQAQAAAARQREETAAAAVTYLASAALEFRRAWAAQLPAAAVVRHANALAPIDEQLAAATDADRLAALPALWALAADESRTQLGGASYLGEALGPQGEVVWGTMVQFGPVTYFAAIGSPVAGLAVTELGSPLPTVFTRLPPDDLRQLRKMTLDNVGMVPVDASLGGALRVERTRETVVAHLRKGGLVMIPLLALALVGAGLALYKLIALSMLGPRGVERRIADILVALHAQRIAEATALAGQLGRPLAPVILEGIAHRDAAKDQLEEILYERLLAQVPALERLLSPLAVCASVAPLLGLLGTVTGMIHTFKLITLFGTGDARLLSSGISEALITTEVGLFIAIPALLVHAYLSRRVRKAVASAQQATLMFINGLKLRLEPEPAASGEAPHG